MKQIVKSKLHSSLLMQFSIISFLVMTAIAFLLIWVIQKELEKNMLMQVIDDAATQVDSIINPSLSKQDLTGTPSPERYEEIDSIIRERVLLGNIVRVKIWNPEGFIVYSDDRDAVGENFSVDHEVEDALAGKVIYDMSHLEKAENVGERGSFDKLAEVYAPLKPQDSETVAGVYEIYVDTGSLALRIDSMRRYVALSVIAGFFILYISLFGIVRKASRELVRRFRENRRLFHEEQTRRTELAALYKSSRMLAEASPRIQENLDIVVRRAIETLNVTVASVDLLQGDTVRRQAVFPARVLSSSPEAGEEIPLEACPLHIRAMNSGEPEVAEKEGFIDYSEQVRRWLMLDFANYVCVVPIHSAGRTLGFLTLAEARQPSREPFATEKIRLASNLADQAANAYLRAELFTRLEQSYLETVLSLASAVEAKDAYTNDHAESMADMALAVGQKLGMDLDELDDLRFAAILHDIGKIGVPDGVLNKPGRLDDDEWVLMKKHPVIGEHILSHIPRLYNASKLVRHHHERYAGGGYPDDIKGDDIALGARILTVIDSYGAMVDRRVYKDPMSRENAIAELKRCSGEQFDPGVVDIFIDLLIADAFAGKAAA